MKCDVCSKESDDCAAGYDAASTFMCGVCRANPPPAQVIVKMVEVSESMCIRHDCLQVFRVGDCCPVHGLPDWLTWLGHGE